MRIEGREGVRPDAAFQSGATAPVSHRPPLAYQPAPFRVELMQRGLHDGEEFARLRGVMALRRAAAHVGAQTCEPLLSVFNALRETAQRIGDFEHAPCPRDNVNCK